MAEVVHHCFKRKYIILYRSTGLNNVVSMCSKADKVTSMAEMEAIGADTPGPIYKVSDYTKKRSMSIKFDAVKSGRLDPIVRTE